MSLEPFQILFATVFRFISLMIVLRTSDIQWPKYNHSSFSNNKQFLLMYLVWRWYLFYLEGFLSWKNMVFCCFWLFMSLENVNYVLSNFIKPLFILEATWWTLNWTFQYSNQWINLKGNLWPNCTTERKW